MKDNASNLLSILASDNVGYFLLVKLDWNSTYYYTTLPYNVAYDGNTYLSGTEVVEFQAPRYSTTVDRESYTIIFSGIDATLESEMTAGIVNRPVEIRVGFTVDGVPQLDPEDTIHSYSGFVATPKLEISDGTKRFIIECSSPLASLDAKAQLYTTRDMQQNIDPTDTCFDQIFDGSESYSLTWGNKKK